MNFPNWTMPIQDALNRATEQRLASVSVPVSALVTLFEAWVQERQAALTMQSERHTITETKDNALTEVAALRKGIATAISTLAAYQQASPQPRADGDVVNPPTAL